MKRNSFFLGCILGAFAPVIAYLFKTFSPLAVAMHPLSLYVVAAAANLLLVRLFYRRTLDRIAHGILLATFIAMLLLIFIDKLRLT